MNESAAPDDRVSRLVRRTGADRIDREYVRTTIESPGWRIFFERTIKPTLDDWRRDLLTRLDLPEDERRGMVQARRLMLEGISECYRRTGAHVPEWFEKELEEMA